MKHLIAILFVAALGLGARPAFAQQTAKVVATCGTAGPYTAGSTNYVTVDVNGNACGAAGGAPSGTQNVNLTGVNGSPPSLANPIFTANSEAPDVTGTFTNATQATAISNTGADGYATALISIHGTYGTATATFLVSDDNGATNYPLLCSRTDGTASELGYTALSNVSRQWVCPVSGNDTITVQSSAVASGTVNVRIGITSPPVSNGLVFSAQSGAWLTGVKGLDGAALASAGNGFPVTLYNTSGNALSAAGTTNGDAVAASGTGQYLRDLVNPYGFNGTSFDRLRSIQGADGTGLGVLATTISPNSSTAQSLTDSHCTVACASILVTGAHNLYGLGFESTVTGWLLIYDATSCQANGTVTPKRYYSYTTANVTQTVSWGALPAAAFATGIAVCFSSTGPFTATASTTAGIWVDYK